MIAFTKRSKILLILIGSFLGLYLVVGSGVIMLTDDPTSLETSNLREALTPYRLLGYLTILALWHPLARYMTRPKVARDELTDSQRSEWSERTRLFAASWWKVAILFAIFELFAVQTIGA